MTSQANALWAIRYIDGELAQISEAESDLRDLQNAIHLRRRHFRRGRAVRALEAASLP